MIVRSEQHMRMHLSQGEEESGSVFQGAMEPISERQAGVCYADPL